MEDLGAPASYMTLEEGVAVYSSDGRAVGKVTHVLAEPHLDVFDGIVIDHSAMPGGHRFCDADQVDEIFERGVVLKLDAAAAEALPKPSANPGEIDVGPDDVVPDELHDKLRRAWDRISGKG
ncbi:MAG: PRC-barrel domain-containing protein [Solirubrobacterales bacterium]